jgi:LmbE family N-acetylglucosaminyl deacetylase
VLGARPVWLPFGSSDYELHGEPDDVRRAVSAVVDGADVVLLPGFPLSHPDHDWLVRELASALDARSTALYAEQPYTRRTGARPSVRPWLTEAFGTRSFEAVPTSARDRVAKWRAIRCYRSQLPLLGMRRSLRRGPLRHALIPEWVAWARD